MIHLIYNKNTTKFITKMTFNLNKSLFKNHDFQWINILELLFKNQQNKTIESMFLLDSYYIIFWFSISSYFNVFFWPFLE